MEKEGGTLYNSYVLEGMGFPFLFITEGYMAKIQKIIWKSRKKGWQSWRKNVNGREDITNT